MDATAALRADTVMTLHGKNNILEWRRVATAVAVAALGLLGGALRRREPDAAAMSRPPARL